MQINTRQVAQAVVLTAIAVVLSPFFIPIGPTKVFPAQHMVNVLAGVLLGPWYAIAIAAAAGIIRVSLGTGTVFAFPGGMIGAFLCGMAFRYFRNTYIAALGEILGTGILGAIISTLIVAPLLLNKTMGWAALIVPFLASTIAGSIIGVLALLALKRAGYGPVEQRLTES
jgi:energy-coupling factor transport system ATP-binding protein